MPPSEYLVKIIVLFRKLPSKLNPFTLLVKVILKSRPLFFLSIPMSRPASRMFDCPSINFAVCWVQKNSTKSSRSTRRNASKEIWALLEPMFLKMSQLHDVSCLFLYLRLIYLRFSSIWCLEPSRRSSIGCSFSCCIPIVFENCQIWKLHSSL